MKTSRFFLLFFSLIVLAVACKKEATPEDKMNLFGNKLAEKVRLQQIDAIKEYYPEIELADSIIQLSPNDSVEVWENKSNVGEYRIKLSQDVTLIANVDENGKIKIVSSKGLFAYTPEKIEFAKKTGLYADSLSDLEFAERMNDEGFISYLTQKAKKISKNILKKGESGVGDGLQVEIINLTDQNILASDYVIKMECYSRGEEPEIILDKGQPIPPHGKIYVEEWGGSGGGITVEDIIIKIPTEDILKRFMKYTGNEYQQYLKSKGK